MSKWFDKEKMAIINPDSFIKKNENMPDVCVACFSKTLMDSLISSLDVSVICSLNNTNGVKPIYKVNYQGVSFGLFQIDVGGPMSATNIEEIHALGCEKFIVFGNCGVLDSSIEDCGILMPTKAIRDEGLSYHYLEDSDYIDMNKKYREIFLNVLNKLDYSYKEVITWTTDAFYRETKNKLAKMTSMGAKTVEMEAASLQAVCDFRGIDLFVYFYAGDNLDTSSWDIRSLLGDVKLDEKTKIALISFELAKEIILNEK